ncbi:peptidoglycan editing factor PgeF [Heyndrickxia sporothermodurans]|uniref:Purine nucleoside phosphorylase n=1 Tax=Heyndrickxia sporothermodurans TaxID=46224 RepID=A0AB37HK01_9BACI|nr:peptidoglycan editing factor PgeF [Heyndrickxia sporothermodurans]MBL5766663.1 peptidoglycan editing factor PgeF [Heyndrickxia sporothermodurans]MBL5770104.1 peptidoglycan editing factor PgeF [Heyndrickxia sporothermodurans]MBL5773782.1 peptidoglycan editing factor PgeF [Heyndrickxia sporothermodurans]MBL5777381.1 peptidoglycan editing factor PgeF [Heyndrickxia sporothermodurans]MBL5780813.1 peptidoglycan editing factor PgeF [Heyndrickxia sporothermodurans]
MFEPFQKKEKEYFIIESWNRLNSNLIAGFTTKNGGKSKNEFQTLNCGFHVGDALTDVQQNRQLLSTKLDFDINSWVGAEQTHGCRIAKVGESEAGKGALDYESSLQNTDGLYTEEKNTLLTLCFADCVPLYFFAPDYNMIGIAHAGWKGTVDGIGKKMVEKWTSEGIAVQHIQAVIGPSICKDCYVVDNRVIAKVNNWMKPNIEMPYEEITPGQFKLDLKKLNQFILELSGIPPENIYLTNYCTRCDQDEFFSHRRDYGKTGRMLSFIGLKGASS